MQKNVQHPTNNPDLPSFVDPDLAEVLPDLELVQDVWNSCKRVEANYLRKEEKEPDKAYRNRLSRTKFDNRFRPMILGYAGLLSNFTLSTNVAPSIQQNQDDINLSGDSLISFLLNVDEMALRDGGCFILVDFPQADPTIQSNADLIASGRRPYLVAIDRRNLLNAQFEMVNGFLSFKQVSIRENWKVNVGAFGCEYCTYYRLLTPGYYQVVEIIENGTDLQVQVVVDANGNRLEGETGLNEIPLIWYSVNESDPFKTVPPFLNHAWLNLEHYQKRSSLNEVLHKCNLPIPVRKGLTVDANTPANLTLGPNSFVDLPSDGDFFFAEPTGAAIAATQSDLVKLETAMDRISLSFLNGGETTKTATEILLDSSQAQATFDSMTQRKESLVSRIFEYWRKYTNETQDGGIQINESILQPPPNPHDIQLVLDYMGIKFSDRTGLAMLMQRGWLPKEFDLDAEEARLAGLQPPERQILASNQTITSEAAVMSQMATNNSGNILNNPAEAIAGRQTVKSTSGGPLE